MNSEHDNVNDNDDDNQTESKEIKNEINNKKQENYINSNNINNYIFLVKDDIIKYENLLKFSNNKNILSDQICLTKIIEELLILVDQEYGKILFPFLSPSCEELLEAYINSTIDEEIYINSPNDFKYIKIFEIMKNNSFISKGSISLIYSYFGSLFYDSKKIDENDKRLSKFLKLKELWKIFYTLPPKNKKKNYSNFSFNGGKLVFKFKQKYDLLTKSVFIKINFILNNYIDKNLDKIIFLKINNQIIEINKKLKDIKDINNILYMEFKIYQNNIELYYHIIGKKIQK